MYIYIILSILIIFSLFIGFLIILKIKLDQLENIIIEKFKEKNNQIPSIYEVTKKYLNKHDEIFNEILKLKKKDFAENNFYDKIIEKNNTNKKIHNELNFIFRVCNKNPKISKNAKFLYLRDIIIDKSFELGNKIEIYKKITKQYNKMIIIKNLTILGLLVPIEKKYSI